MSADAFDRAKGDAMALLSKRAFSRGALLERLAKKNHDEDARERAVAEMERLGLVDDEALAADVVDRELEKAPADRAYLRRRLATRGVDPDAAERAIEEALCGRDPLESATEAARSIRDRMPENLARGALVRRLAGRLARRGFEEEVALEAAQRIAEAEIAPD
jgi:regulatory protein